jgi:hypothetical protein
LRNKHWASGLSPLPGLEIIYYYLPRWLAAPANFRRASGAKNIDFAIY